MRWERDFSSLVGREGGCECEVGGGIEVRSERVEGWLRELLVVWKMIETAFTCHA